jgi:hypothetical protein
MMYSVRVCARARACVYKQREEWFDGGPRKTFYYHHHHHHYPHHHHLIIIIIIISIIYMIQPRSAQAMDMDKSGGLDSKEFCVAMRKLVCSDVI